MRMHCDNAESHLEETNESCKALLERAGSLRQERSVKVLSCRLPLLIGYYLARKSP
jgi:hypothetical protein